MEHKHSLGTLLLSTPGQNQAYGQAPYHTAPPHHAGNLLKAGPAPQQMYPHVKLQTPHASEPQTQSL